MIGWKILSTNSVDIFVDIIVQVTQKPNFTNLSQFV